MAELFLARSSAQHGFEKTVVLKRILPSFAEQGDFVQMFLNEARLAAGLHHPNIAQVFDFGEDDGDYFFTMEYVAGRNLRQLIGAARRASVSLPLGCALHIIENVAAGLHHAHEHRDSDGKALQIVHRDVSPSNVIVTYEGNVKLVDFGVAKIAALGPATLAGSLKGKVSYMSPEQCRGELVDRRSDIFSLGTLLWELTTGRQLFGGDASGLALLKRVEEADVPPPTSLIPNYPPDLEEVLLKALARNRDDRYPTALDFRVAIEDFGYQHRVPLTSTKLSSYMESLFPPEGRNTASRMRSLPQMRGAAPSPKSQPKPAAKPAPLTPPKTVVAPVPSRPQLTKVPRHRPEEPEESKTLVADGPADPEETSPTMADVDRPEIAVQMPRRDTGARWLIWFGVAVIGLGMTAGIAWRFINEAEPPTAVTNHVSKPPPEEPKAVPEPVEVPTPAVPLPSSLDELRALSYAERHAALATAKGSVQVDLHVGLDLIQAADAEHPCRTFADALNTIEASDDPQVYRWALDDATAPTGKARTCRGLEQRLAALTTDPGTNEPTSTKRRTRKRTRQAPTAAPTPPEPVVEEPVTPEPAEPATPEPTPSVATKLDEDLRGIGG